MILFCYTLLLVLINVVRMYTTENYNSLIKSLNVEKGLQYVLEKRQSLSKKLSVKLRVRRPHSVNHYQSNNTDLSASHFPISKLTQTTVPDAHEHAR